MCYSEGEVGPVERKLLEKIREKLGISVERAKELEMSLKNKCLTKDEQEYLRTYKECLADGSITKQGRRLLDKLRCMLDISENRAREIENM